MSEENEKKIIDVLGDILNKLKSIDSSLVVVSEKLGNIEIGTDETVNALVRIEESRQL